MADDPAVPQRDREATRHRLLEAGRRLFTRHGYDQVSVRDIAAEAGVNAALINRYFGSKRGLFGEVLDSESALPSLLEGPEETLPRRLAEYVAERLRTGPSSSTLSAVDRSTASPELRSILQDRLETQFITPLGGILHGPDARLRAMLAVLVVAGSGSVRRLFTEEELYGDDPELLIERLTEIFTSCLAPRAGRG